MARLAVLTLGIILVNSQVPSNIYGDICESNNCTYDCVNNNCSYTKIICLETVNLCTINCMESHCNGLYIYSGAYETTLNCDGNKACFNSLTNDNDKQLHLYCGEYGHISEYYTDNSNFNEPINTCAVNCHGFQSCRNTFIYGKGNINNVFVNSITNNNASLYDTNLFCNINSDDSCTLTCGSGNCNIDASFQCKSGKCSCIGNSCNTIDTINLNVVDQGNNNGKLVTISVVTVVLLIMLGVICVFVGRKLIREHKALENELTSMKDVRNSIINASAGTSLHTSHPNHGSNHSNINKKYMINITSPSNEAYFEGSALGKPAAIMSDASADIISPLSTTNNPFNTNHNSKHTSTHMQLEHETVKSMISDFSGVSSATAQSNSTVLTHNTKVTNNTSLSSSSCTSASSLSSSHSSNSSSSSNSHSTQTDMNLEEKKDNISHHNSSNNATKNSNPNNEGINNEHTVTNHVWSEDDFKNIGSFDKLHKTMNKHAKEFIRSQQQQQRQQQQYLAVNNGNGINNNDDNSTILTTNTSLTTSSGSTSTSDTSISSGSTSNTSLSSASTSSSGSSLSVSTNNSSDTSSVSCDLSSNTTSVSDNTDDASTSSASSSESNENDKLMNHNNTNDTSDEDDNGLHHMASVSDIDPKEKRNDYDLL